MWPAAENKETQMRKALLPEGRRAVSCRAAWSWLAPVAAVAALLPAAADAQLASGLAGSVGSTVGPDGALYVPESAAGRITRIDPMTGAMSTFADGLPATLPGVPFGGAVDVAFVGSTAYALVTMVDAFFGGSDVVGIYRIDGAGSHEPIADIGSFTIANPSGTDWFIPSGVQYAMEPWRGGFLVTDGHHNRVLHVTLGGEVSEFRGFDNIVPTGLEVQGHTVYMARMGEVPHTAQDGQVIAFGPGSASARVVAAGAPMLVDVERGRGQTMFALSQGTWDGAFPGSPANPGEGSLVRVNGDGSFSVVADGLNLPSSLEIIGNTGYVVTLVGEVWAIPNLAGPPFGETR
jgi:hypothetical protein